MKTAKYLILFTWILFLVPLGKAQTLHIHVKKLKTETPGIIRVGIFNSEEQFKSEEAHIEKEISKSEIKNGELNIYVNLEPGIYGATILDDENYNRRMDFNLLGFPKEGFGLTNIKRMCLKKPKFKDISFTLQANETKKVEIIMLY